MFKKLTAILIAFCIAVLFTACDYSAAKSSKLKIITTIFPTYEFAKEIVGDKGEVILLLPPGTESHSFEPSVKEMVDIKNSDLFIYTGNNMENWAKDLEKDANALNVSYNINIENNDPHIWTSPKNAMQMAKNIAETLISKDSINQGYYEANLNAYLTKLSALDTALTALPKEKTIVFGGRNPFYYLLRDYNITALSAYKDCSEHTEPTPKAIAQIIDSIKAQGLTTVYYEELANTDVAEEISKQTGATMLLLHSCHNIAKDEKNPSYIKLMEQNIQNLQKGLS